MRSFSVTRLFAAALLLLLGFVFVRPAWAQEDRDDPEEENQEAEGDDDPEKETCNPPEFTFTWQGYDLVKLTATADPAQAFIITLNYLEPPRKEGGFEPLRLLPARATGPQTACADHEPSGDGLSEGVTFCLNATKDGSTAALFMDRQALLKAGGLVGLSYEALPDDIGKVCLARRRGPENPVRKALDKHSLSFDIGSVFNLQGEGSWDASMEAAAVSRSQWYDWLQTGFSVRYSSLGAVDEPEEEEEDGDDDGGGDGDDGEDEEEEEFNPFESGGGLLETNVYVMFSLPKVPRLGLVTGWGLSSVPGAADSKLELRERTFVGLRNSIQAFNAGRIGDTLENSSGYIQAGIANDDLWERVELKPASEDGTEPAEISDESERYFFEGEFDIPRVGTEWFRINLRFFASVPRSGDGPSDLRISALASIDPRRWFPGFAQGN